MHPTTVTIISATAINSSHFPTGRNINAGRCSLISLDPTLRSRVRLSVPSGRPPFFTGGICWNASEGRVCRHSLTVSQVADRGVEHRGQEHSEERHTDHAEEDHCAESLSHL